MNNEKEGKYTAVVKNYLRNGDVVTKLVKTDNPAFSPENKARAKEIIEAIEILNGHIKYV